MSQLIMELCDRLVCNTYARYPVTFERGAGCRLWDTEGEEYVDFVAGIAVCNLGHSHPEVARVVCEQAQKLVHVSNLFYTGPQVHLAQMLIERSFADKVFFANSGAEANEAAIKLARKYSRDKYGPGRFHVITMEDSFHGRTLATLSATGQEKVHQGFDPLVEGFHYVPYNSVEAVERAITEKTCAVLVEPIQGEGGVRIGDLDYFRALRELCTAKDILLIFDEVQTGMGRTGTLFAYEQLGVTPDVMTLAKALGNGLPIGAMLATAQAAQAFTPGSHASTFGGTPLVTAAAAKVLEIISDEDFLSQVRDTGRYFLERLEDLRDRHSGLIRDARGRGLMLALELVGPGKTVVDRCLEKGVIINCTHETVLRFVPPLVVSRQEIDRVADTLDTVLKELEG
ncbi:acetylornithine aminotransferase apoenzyme [Desulfacinum hydrothermale DSM 13146]|uniref:Acetylornithine aminotransferase n=1 Tax=Desulfacinum hydrothermale DSM 13146 TaxID=1121390 RepID=A0A1W1X8G7_9BACT|nr:aspartate aminotransferase family protein [Desulfacinum hydrothermale]SMC20124.1 acetylornithine aminotransferase apoenzyme [Desulfacinum hydrothermale DSM 13146]